MIVSKVKRTLEDSRGCEETNLQKNAKGDFIFCCCETIIL